jgi:hypothetical protein
MKNLLVVIVLACITGFSASSHAVTVKGMEKCEAWVRNRAMQPAPSWNSRVDSAWLAGYLSGVAVARDIEFLKGVDDKLIKSWMDNYCRSHPSERVGYAADALSVELKNRMN